MIDSAAAQDLADAITERLAARKAEAIARAQERRQQRAEFAARRNAGLKRRHATKLARIAQAEAE